MPSRTVRTVAPAVTTGSSSNRLVGPTTSGACTRTRMPSIDSQKSMPSTAGSNVLSSSTSPLESSSMILLGGVRRSGPTTVAAGTRSSGPVSTELAAI